MSQYSGVPSVWIVHGCGEASDSSAFICVQADSAGYSISDATFSYVPGGTFALNELVVLRQKQPLGSSIVLARSSVRSLRRRSMHAARVSCESHG